MKNIIQRNRMLKSLLILFGIGLIGCAHPIKVNKPNKVSKLECTVYKKYKDNGVAIVLSKDCGMRGMFAVMVLSKPYDVNIRRTVSILKRLLGYNPILYTLFYKKVDTPQGEVFLLAVKVEHGKKEKKLQRREKNDTGMY